MVKSFFMGFLIGGMLRAEPVKEEPHIDKAKLLVTQEQPTNNAVRDLESKFKPEQERESCCSLYVDLDREATKTEIVVVGAIPMYLFCSKLGWPFCCLCM